MRYYLSAEVKKKYWRYINIHQGKFRWYYTISRITTKDYSLSYIRTCLKLYKVPHWKSTVIMKKIILLLLLTTSCFAKEPLKEDVYPPAPSVIEVVSGIKNREFFPADLLKNKTEITGNKFECKNVVVKDADTICVDIFISEFNVLLLKQNIRAINFDSCEVSKHRDSVIVTDKEIALGKQAKTYLQDIVNRKFKIFISPNGHDVYGRTLAVIWVEIPMPDPNNFSQVYYLDLAEIIKYYHFDRSQL